MRWKKAPNPLKWLPLQQFFLTLYVLGIAENNKLCAVAENLMGAAGMGFTAGVRLEHGTPEKRWGARATRRIVWRSFSLWLCRGSWCVQGRAAVGLPHESCRG